MRVIYLNVNEAKAPEIMDIEDNLQTYYNLIQCDTIDIVRMNINGKAYDIVCDDEALFKTDVKASAFDDEYHPQLYGNLIITGCADVEGILTSLTEEDINNIRGNCILSLSCCERDMFRIYFIFKNFKQWRYKGE